MLFFRKRTAVSPATLLEWSAWVIGTVLAIAKGARDGKYTEEYFRKARPILQTIREGKPLEPVCAKLLKPTPSTKRIRRQSTLLIDCSAPAPTNLLHVKGEVESHDVSMGRWGWNPFQIELYSPPDQERPGFCFDLDRIKEELAGRSFPNASVLQGLLEHPWLISGKIHGDTLTVFLGTIYKNEQGKRYALCLCRAYDMGLFSSDYHWISDRFYLDGGRGHHEKGRIRVAVYINIGEGGTHSLD